MDDRSGVEVLFRFIKASSEDPKIQPTHVSLYLALFYCWGSKNYEHLFTIDREEVMQLGKILGRSTYQKCLQELKGFGYIDYEASFNRFKKTVIELKKDNSEKDVSSVGAQLTSDRNCERGLAR